MAKLIQSKQWFNVELTKDDATRFRNFCKGYGVKFETSQAGNLVHFEVLCDLYDLKTLDSFLADL